jgi:two-component system repressor protein LuxO
LQAKLLRFLQTGTVQRVGSGAAESVDVRLICATNRDPLAEIAAGRFREDLYYRLHVIPIHLPPLRERGEDVLEIARTLIGEIATEEGRPQKRLASDAEAAIATYHWPGNIRQLQNVLRNVVLLSHAELITAGMLPQPVRPGAAVPEPRRTASPAILVRPDTVGSNGSASGVMTGNPPLPAAVKVEPLWVLEKRAIENAIRVYADNIARAAAALEISPSTIYRKRQGWAIGNSGLHVGGE